MHEQTMNFNNKSNALNFNQFRFIHDLNTSDALMEFLDNVYEAMKKVLLAIFLDSSKAADAVDH